MQKDATDQDYLDEIHRSFRTHFDDDLPENLVVPSSKARWIDPSEISNPARIGPMLDLPTRSFDLSLQEIPQGSATDLQRHAHEAVHYVLSGSGYSEIGGCKLYWNDGDFIYTPVWVWHRHYNTGTAAARLLIVESAKLLATLGLHQRQSAGNVSYADHLRFAANKPCQVTP